MMLPAREEEFDGQSEQIAGPKPALYWFLLHCEHVEPFCPVYPALHKHDNFVMLPAGEEECDGQSEQVAGPKPALYILILHCEHAVPFCPVYPALHKQAVFVMLPAGEEEFGGQAVQLAGPKASLYWFILHREHAMPFSPIYPALHSHQVFLMLPAGEEEFDGQSEQAAGPKPALYWFIPHCEHAVPLSPVYPALHSQENFVMLPAGEEEFDGQSEQLAGPKPVLYWFILHCKHAVPLSPVYPALHSQAIFVMLPEGEKEFEGQAVQLAVAFTGENLPVRHDIHRSDPGDDLKVPTAHGVHVSSPSGPLDPELQVHTFAVEPLTREDLPVPQDVHGAGPDDVLKVSSAHGVHVSSPSGPLDPELQVHTFVIEPLTREDLPVPHEVHGVVPDDVLKEPSAHNVHISSPSGPLDPGLQIHTFVVEPLTREYLPVPHDVHGADPDDVLKVPSAHDVHVSSPSGPLDPELQVHTFVIEPLTREYLPIPQDVHGADPDDVLKVPSAHDVHVSSPSGPLDPELQVHTFVIEPLTSEYLPIPQDVHGADPDDVLKVPSAHDVHVSSPSGPLDPELQVHTFVVEPVNREDLPIPQDVHGADPGDVLKEPSAQGVHVSSPSGPLDPELQLHTFVPEPLTIEYLPVPHEVHIANPDDGL